MSPVMNGPKLNASLGPLRHLHKIYGVMDAKPLAMVVHNSSLLTVSLSQ